MGHNLCLHAKISGSHKIFDGLGVLDKHDKAQQAHMTCHHNALLTRMNVSHTSTLTQEFYSRFIVDMSSLSGSFTVFYVLSVCFLHTFYPRNCYDDTIKIV